MRAVLQQKDSLRILKLLSPHQGLSWVNDGKSNAIGFKEFSALQELVVSHRLFFGVGTKQTIDSDILERHVLQTLPPGLQKFSIMRCDEKHLSPTARAIEAAALQRDTKFPALREISLHIEHNAWRAEACLNERV